MAPVGTGQERDDVTVALSVYLERAALNISPKPAGETFSGRIVEWDTGVQESASASMARRDRRPRARAVERVRKSFLGHGAATALTKR